ncbi:MAG: FHA domain-containing protein, partial [Anaerolineae bacterium]|nr:FHA domain-containing protein [Anaerolineae bacterium]
MVDFAGRKLKNQMLPVREVEFKQPVVNIGSHGDNDLILTGDGIQPFHAMLMSQDGKFRMAALSADADIRVNGQPLSGESQIITDGQRIELGNDYAIIVQRTKSSNGVYVKLYQSASKLNVKEYKVPEGEEAILVNIVSQLNETAVEMGATYNLEVINAGPIVASFQIIVDGVPQEWVQVNPDEVNLNEGLRANVQVTITPPRASTSAAGKHAITIMVLSPNYPGNIAEVNTELIIQPYYEFSVGALSPKNQNIFWKLHSGHTRLPITNQGNSAGNFDVTTMDDENGCSFEYQVKEGYSLNRQATVNIPAGETVELPIEVTPLKHPIASFRNKRYHYTTTVQASGQSVSPQMVSGAAVSIPLFGWWSIVLALLLVVLGLFILVQPRIYSFQVASGKDVIEQGDTTTLEWSVSPFATRINIAGIDKQVESGQTHMTIQPQQSTTYEMVA